MILGIGSDLVDIRRIEKTLARFGPRFVARVFTETEQALAEARQGQARAAAYAKRWAAKEACAKALGTGFAQGVAWRDLAVGALASGRPTLTLHGAAADHLAAMVPAGMIGQVDLTMSDDYPLAQAFVVISAR